MDELIKTVVSSGNLEPVVYLKLLILYVSANIVIPLVRNVIEWFARKRNINLEDKKRERVEIAKAVFKEAVNLNRDRFSDFLDPDFPRKAYEYYYRLYSVYPVFANHIIELVEFSRGIKDRAILDERKENGKEIPDYLNPLSRFSLGKFTKILIETIDQCQQIIDKCPSKVKLVDFSNSNIGD